MFFDAGASKFLEVSVGKSFYQQQSQQTIDNYVREANDDFSERHIAKFFLRLFLEFIALL